MPATATNLPADKLCISQEIVTNALGSDPNRYAANLSWFPTSRQKLVLMVSLIANFSLCGEAGEADRLYDAAAKITDKVDMKTRARLMKRARHFALVARLRSGDPARLAAHLDNTGGYDGKATDLFRKATRVYYAMRALHNLQIKFDDRLAGQAVVHWLKRQPGGMAAGLSRNAAPDKNARRLIRQAGRLAATFLEYGYQDGAAELATAFPDRSVSRDIDKQMRRNAQKVEDFAKVVRQLSSGRGDDLIDDIVTATAKPRLFSRKKPRAELILDETYRRLVRISAKLRQDGKPELIDPLLHAASRYARTIDPPVCRIWFSVRMAGMSVATGNKGVYAQLTSQLPMDQGKLALSHKAECGVLPVFYYADQPKVLDTFASGIAAISTIPPSEDTGVMDLDFFTGVYLMFGETYPLFDREVVVTFYRRAAQILADRIKGSLMLPTIGMADRAFRTGYTAAALELTEVSLRHTIEWKRGPGPHRNRRAGLAVD